MRQEQVQKAILVQALAETLYYDKKQYYAGKASLTDEAYDKLEQELKRLCPEHPLLTNVGDGEEGLIGLRETIELL